MFGKEWRNIREAGAAGVAEAGRTAMALVIREASGTWKAKGAEGDSPCRNRGMWVLNSTLTFHVIMNLSLWRWEDKIYFYIAVCSLIYHLNVGHEVGGPLFVHVEDSLPSSGLFSSVTNQEARTLLGSVLTTHVFIRFPFILFYIFIYFTNDNILLFKKSIPNAGFRKYW